MAGSYRSGRSQIYTFKDRVTTLKADNRSVFGEH